MTTTLIYRNIKTRFEKYDDGECWIIEEKDLGTLGTFTSKAQKVTPEAGNAYYIQLLKKGYKKA